MSALTLLFWYQEDHLACKNRAMKAGMAICLERDANDLHLVQLMPLPPRHLFIKTQDGLTFLVPAYRGCSA